MVGTDFPSLILPVPGFPPAARSMERMERRDLGMDQVPLLPPERVEAGAPLLALAILREETCCERGGRGLARPPLAPALFQALGGREELVIDRACGGEVPPEVEGPAMEGNKSTSSVEC